MKSNNHAGLAEKLYKVAVPNGMAYHGGQGVADRQGVADCPTDAVFEWRS